MTNESTTRIPETLRSAGKGSILGLTLGFGVGTAVGVAVGVGVGVAVGTGIGVVFSLASKARRRNARAQTASEATDDTDAG